MNAANDTFYIKWLFLGVTDPKIDPLFFLYDIILH